MILDRFLLTDRAAVVTGAGRGIGAATAVALAEAGADVLVSSRTESQLTEVANQIEATGRRTVVVPADLSDLDAVAELAESAHQAFGRLDIVVNNVGGAMPRELLKTSPRYLEEAFHFNVSTAHTLTRAAVPLMLAGHARDGTGTGAVVNISSVMGRVSGRGYLAYGTAKAALVHYTRLAARDLAPRVRVNAVAVGSVATSALEIVLADDASRTAMEQATPLRRIGEPDDIAAVALFLASDAAAYVTGKVGEADGGLDQPNLELDFPDL
jgi:7-alpha-hydroxysteroid dehydrogenase